jgi:hypothetical protein
MIMWLARHLPWVFLERELTTRHGSQGQFEKAALLIFLAIATAKDQVLG